MDFEPLLAEPEHDSAFGEDQRIVALDLVQQAQRGIVTRTGTDRRVKPRDGFQVVVIDVRSGRDYGFDRFTHLAAKVRGEDFDCRVGGIGPQCLDHLDELPGPAIGQVIAVNRGDHDMLKPQLGSRQCDVFRFERIDGARHPGLDVAERTGAGADVTQDHHCGVLFGPAFADIGASRFFAYGIELQVAHQLAGFAIALAGRSLDPDPVRLALARLGRGDIGEVVHGAQIGACTRACQSEFLAPLGRP